MYGLIHIISFPLLVGRFFFKTACYDSESPVLQEIRDDSEMVPQFDGKVDCRVSDFE